MEIGVVLQPADEKGRTLLGSRTAPLPDTQDRSVLAPGRGEREVRSADPAASSGEREALAPIRDVRRWQGRTRSRWGMAAAPPTASCGACRGSGCTSSPSPSPTRMPTGSAGRYRDAT